MARKFVGAAKFFYLCFKFYDFLERTDLSIDDNDFYLEEKRSSSKDIFGVYEVVIIFLCSNFLTYYKCYFNFIQNKKIDEENCEYLYDSIVSVKVQDKSRSGDNSKDTYRKRLLITTSDGKIVCFRFPRRDRKSTRLNSSHVD